MPREVIHLATIVFSMKDIENKLEFKLIIACLVWMHRKVSIINWVQVTLREKEEVSSINKICRQKGKITLHTQFLRVLITEELEMVSLFSSKMSCIRILRIQFFNLKALLKNIIKDAYSKIKNREKKTQVSKVLKTRNSI